MRKYLLPPLAVLVILTIGSECPGPVALEQPKVSWSVADQGGTLVLTWNAVDGADGYKIYSDGKSTPDTTISGTTISITDPKKSVTVEAYNSDYAADSTISLSATATVTTLNVHGISAGLTDDAFGFSTTTGIAVAMDAVVGPDIDFVMEDRAPDPMSFWSPTSYNPVYNNKDNAASVATGITDFNALKICAAPGNYFTKLQISENAVYSLWIDVTGDGYSTDDHFAKSQVVSISGTAVTLKLAYQKVGGLRWLVTE